MTIHEEALTLMSEFLEERLDECPSETYGEAMEWCEDCCNDDFALCWRRHFLGKAARSFAKRDIAI